MRILTMCLEYPPVGGGGGHVCREIAEALVRQGHEIDVVTSSMPDLDRYEETKGVRVHRVKAWRKHRYHATWPELLTQVVPSITKAVGLHRAEPYDILHAHFVVPTGLSAYFAHRATGLPYVVTAHGSDVPGYNADRFTGIHQMLAPIWRRILSASGAVTTPTVYLAELIQAQIRREVAIIPNAFDGPVTRPHPRRNQILVVTRLLRRKGVQHLIEAVARMGMDWEVVVAGDGPFLPDLRQLAEARGVPVRFLGFVAREELPALYHESKIFAFPSEQENFPMVLLEGMSAGCAVVTTTAAGCLEVVGDAAITVAPNDVPQLQDALSLLIADERRINLLGHRAQLRAAEFAPDRIAELYAGLFLDCLGREDATFARPLIKAATGSVPIVVP